MDIAARLREFTTKDFVFSYASKLFAGLGLGLLFPESWHAWGWFFILLAILLGFRAEVKFWRSRK